MLGHGSRHHHYHQLTTTHHRPTTDPPPTHHPLHHPRHPHHPQALTTGAIGIDIGSGAEHPRRWLVARDAAGCAAVSEVASAAALDGAAEVTVAYQDEATFLKLLLREM